MGFEMGFGMFNIMFFLIFGIVIVMFIVTAVKGISTWNKNNNSPRLTVEATVSSKRQNVDVHHHNTGDNNAMHTTTSTTYYVTFQVASGDRMELRVDGREYGQLAEGDFGELTFQGTRYLALSAGAARRPTTTGLRMAAIASEPRGIRNDKRKYSSRGTLPCGASLCCYEKGKD